MADFDEDEGVERAREFRIAINRKRPSRRRYALTHQTSAFENTASSSHSSFNFAEAVPLQAIGGEPLYRELDEKESLSRLRNGIKKYVPQPIRKALLPPRNRVEWRKFIFVHLPVLHWLWSYRPKQLIGDIISGITIGVTHIPQGEWLRGGARRVLSSRGGFPDAYCSKQTNPRCEYYKLPI